MNKFKMLGALALSLSVAGLVACGGGGGGPTLFAKADTVAAITGTNVTALAGKTFTFPSGAAAFGTAGAATTVTFDTANTFTVVSGGNTVKGALSFGSCIFTLAAPTVFPPAWGVASPLEITPCNINVGTAGKAANGTSIDVPASLVLGAGKSSALTIPVVISGTGSVTINGIVVGSVTTGSATGTGSGS